MDTGVRRRKALSQNGDGNPTPSKEPKDRVNQVWSTSAAKTLRLRQTAKLWPGGRPRSGNKNTSTTERLEGSFARIRTNASRNAPRSARATCRAEDDFPERVLNAESPLHGFWRPRRLSHNTSVSMLCASNHSHCCKGRQRCTHQNLSHNAQHAPQGLPRMTPYGAQALRHRLNGAVRRDAACSRSGRWVS